MGPCSPAALAAVRSASTPLRFPPATGSIVARRSNPQAGAAHRPPVDSLAMGSRSVFLAWLGEEARDEVRQDADVFLRCMDAARVRAAGPDIGFFGPGTQMWRIVGETTVSLGGMRAVLMQLAHPAIAAAGLQSSTFRADFLGRAWRTFSVMSQLIFGDLDTATGASRRLHVLHARTRGELPVAASPARAGERYRGTDPALLLWVLATLYERSVFAYGRFVAPLSDGERRAYWEDNRLLGLLLGIPEDEMPPTIEDFDLYWAAMEDDVLEAGPAARELAAYLVRSPLDHSPPWLRRQRVGRLAASWTAGSAPPRWAHALGVDQDGGPLREFERQTPAVRRAVAAVPVALRHVPAYHQGVLRVARADGAQPPRAARAVERASRRWRLPMGLEPLKALEGDDELILADLFDR